MRARKTIDYKAQEDAYADLGGSDSDSDAPKKKPSRQKRKAASSDEDYGGSDEEEEEGGGRRRRGKAEKKAAATRDGDDDDKKEGKMGKEEQKNEDEARAAIWANPPPAVWKPAETPGHDSKREERSKRGHLFPKGHRNHFPPYLDPAYDVTDRGVEHIVTTMAQKCLPLLKDGLGRKDGFLSAPITAQTVCSGTDAPIIGISRDSTILFTPLSVHTTVHTPFSAHTSVRTSRPSVYLC